MLAKTALLSGPLGARRLLRRRGGVLQHDDGRIEIVPAALRRAPPPARRGVSTDPLDYPFWLASRSAGVVAYVLLSASVVLGLAPATRLVRGRGLHERIALLALGAVAAHGLLLLADGWLRPAR